MKKWLTIALVFVMGLATALMLHQSYDMQAQARPKGRLVADEPLRIAVVSLRDCYEGTQFHSDIVSRIQESAAIFDKQLEEAEKDYKIKEEELRRTEETSGQSRLDELTRLRNEKDRLEEKYKAIASIRRKTVEGAQAKYFDRLLAGVSIKISEVAEDLKYDLVFKRIKFDADEDSEEASQISEFTQRLSLAPLLYHNGDEAGKPTFTVLDISDKVKDKLLETKYTDLREEILKKLGEQ